MEDRADGWSQPGAPHWRRWTRRRAVLAGARRGRSIEALNNARRAIDAQRVINELLRLALEPLTLEDIASHVLDRLVAIPWLAFEAVGALFLVDEDAPERELVMVAHAGMPAELLTLCHRIERGRCLCGRAAQSGALEFAPSIDARHEVTYPGMEPHGHYCGPSTTATRRWAS